MKSGLVKDCKFFKTSSNILVNNDRLTTPEFDIAHMTSMYLGTFTWFSILLCGILATCTGLSYSELASMFPKNGGEFFYVKEAMNDDLAKFTGFIILFTEILSVTAISFALSGYISKYVKIPVNAMASILILIFSFLN